MCSQNVPDGRRPESEGGRADHRRKGPGDEIDQHSSMRQVSQRSRWPCQRCRSWRDHGDDRTSQVHQSEPRLHQRPGRQRVLDGQQRLSRCQSRGSLQVVAAASVANNQHGKHDWRQSRHPCPPGRRAAISPSARCECSRPQRHVQPVVERCRK